MGELTFDEQRTRAYSYDELRTACTIAVMLQAVRDTSPDDETLGSYALEILNLCAASSDTTEPGAGE